MTDKVQGEGDYESARRYDRHVAEAVKKGIKKPEGQPELNEEELEAAEKAGRERAKEIDHDATDAKLMRNFVDIKSTKIFS
jgi:hypothetical protein